MQPRFTWSVRESCDARCNLSGTLFVVFAKTAKNACDVSTPRKDGTSLISVVNRTGPSGRRTEHRMILAETPKTPGVKSSHPALTAKNACSTISGELRIHAYGLRPAAGEHLSLMYGRESLGPTCWAKGVRCRMRVYDRTKKKLLGSLRFWTNTTD